MPSIRSDPPPKSPEWKQRDPVLDLEIRVMTPLFGGGVTAGEVDSELPVRGSSIRGQLRFWWRACRGPAFQTPAELYEAESAIWGSMGENGLAGPSKVDVRVEILDKGQVAMLSDLVRGQSDPRGYALFPLRDVENGSCQTGIRFALRIYFARHVNPAEREELHASIDASVWAWLTFGGIGARTRRGCGSLWTAHDQFKLPESPSQISDWLQQQARKYVSSGERVGLHPVLAGSRFVIGRAQNPDQGWSEALRIMKDLRQKPGFARNEGQRKNRPGRSRWPEPDSLRDLFDLDRNHRPEHKARPAYPRADLGLPIIFQQLDRKNPELRPSDQTRMASPVILKPLATAPDRAMPLVLVLNTPHVWDDNAPEIEIKHDRVTKLIPGTQLNVAEKSADIGPLQELGVTSARDAVLKLAAREWGNKEGRLA